MISKRYSLSRRLWLAHHFTAVGLIAVLAVVNAMQATRPFRDSRSPLKLHRSSPFRLATTPMSEGAADAAGGAVGASAGGRTPASAASVEALAHLSLIEATVGCEVAATLRIPSSIRQLRLQIQTCIDSAPPIQAVRNDSNGFEATLFPGTTVISTDYMSLSKGANTLKIERGTTAQIITIHRID